MKKYTPTYKTKTTYYFSYNFDITLEDDDRYTEYEIKQKALEELLWQIKNNAKWEITDQLELVEEEKEEYEYEPDWDMLPGGKDHE